MFLTGKGWRSGGGSTFQNVILRRLRQRPRKDPLDSFHSLRTSLGGWFPETRFGRPPGHPRALKDPPTDPRFICHSELARAQGGPTKRMNAAASRLMPRDCRRMSLEARTEGPRRNLGGCGWERGPKNRAPGLP